MRARCLVPALTALIAAAVPAAGQSIAAEPGLPDAYRLENRAGWVDGYRSALFGMDVAAVRAALQADFGGAVPTETMLPSGDLYLDLAGVRDDALGPISVRYVVLADGGLAAVTVQRTGEGASPAAARADVLAASARYAAGVLGLRWAPFALQTGIETPAGGRIALRTYDLNGNGLELRLLGIDAGRIPRSGTGRTAGDSVRPLLSVNFVRNLGSMADIGAKDY